MRGKKIWKKGIIGGICVALAFSLAGCGQAKPEDTVKKGLDAMIAGDFKTADKYFDGGEEWTLGSEENESVELIKVIFSQIEYDVQNAENSEKTATVTTEIKTVDMDSVMEDVASEVLQATFKDSDMDKEEMKAKTIHILSETIRKTTKTKSFTVNVELKMVDEGWKMKGSDELLNAMLGGMDSITDLY